MRKRQLQLELEAARTELRSLREIMAETNGFLSDQIRRLVAERHSLTQAALQRRIGLLAEWDTIRALTVEERTQTMETRLFQLTEELWPEPSRNPVNGIRRVPGGHGFPVRYKASELVRGD